MKVHSDILTAADVREAACVARTHGQDIYVDEIMANGSRSRRNGITFYAASEHGKRSTNRQRRDSGVRAASWTAYGYLIAELFARDPEAIVGQYKDADDYARQVTRYTPRGESLDFLSIIGVKVIERLERASSSRNGNPAYNVYFTDGTYARTSSDASVSYEIGNPDMREGCPVRVTYTASGRISYMRAV